MINITFTGDWRKAKRVLTGLPITLKQAATMGQEVAAEKLRKIVVAHIRNQDLGWPPKSERASRNDSRILVDSGTYLKSIKTWKSGNSYMVGVPRNVYSPKGQRTADYAVWNEYGGGRGPARPVWGPSFKEMGGAQGIQAIIARVMKKRIATVIAAS